jgi:imidazolonepropionase-like amidohydrolase
MSTRSIGRGVLAGIVLVGAGHVAGVTRTRPLDDTGTIRVHLLGHAIGSERYSIRPDGGALALTDTFEFVDRGGRIQLATTLRFTPAFAPLHLRSTGRTYRFVNVDAEVVVDDKRVHIRNLDDTATVAAPTHFFAISGYAPLEVQALLVRYWQTHGRPKSIVTAPGDPTNTVAVEDLGPARVNLAPGERLALRRFSIDGVAWGREILYLDSASRFAAIVTRANLLPLEGVREDLAASHPALLDSILADAARAELAAAASTSATIPAVAQADFAILGARIVDATTRPPIEDGTVLVHDGRIAAVGPRQTVALPGGMRTIDARGKTIIPGLWDMHAHAALPEWGPAYLGVGVTTTRDMGGEKRFLMAFRDAIAARRVLGPRLLLAGLVDGSGAEAFGTVYADTPEEGRTVVDAYHAAGFQQMKLYTLIKPDVAGAIIRRAHELGMTVTGHVPRAMTLASMVDSGADNVAHLPVRGDTSSAAVKEQIRMLAAKRVVIDPTVSWNELLGHSNQLPLTTFQPGFSEAPWPLRSSYGSVRNAGDSTAATRTLRSQLAVIKAMHDAGVRIVAGTDYGLPGFSLLRELELYVDAGFSPLDAIRAATVVPADVMGLSGEVGTIEAGKRADLVVLDRDPLSDIHNLRTGHWVVAGGRMFDMTMLRRAVHFTGVRRTSDTARVEAATTAPAPRFVAHEIATGLRGGYQVVAADLNHDGKPDLIAVASNLSELLWFENPSWTRHVVAGGFTGLINVAAADVDGDGIPEIAVASGFSTRPDQSAGIVALLTHGPDPTQPWTMREIDRAPAAHRLRWYTDRDGQRWLVNAPLAGATAQPPNYDGATPIYAYRAPNWKREQLPSDEAGVVHAVEPVRAPFCDACLLSAGFAGIHRYERSGGAWSHVAIAVGDPAAVPKGGSSDVAVGRASREPTTAGDNVFIAAIEPWHGNQVVVYRRVRSGVYARQVIDTAVVDGHTLVTALQTGPIVAGGTMYVT